MSSNTVISTNQPEFEPDFSRSERYKDDPFTVVDGHYVGNDGFVVPNDFLEFFERFPNYIRTWVHRHAYWCSAADAEDLEQDLIVHLQHLNPSSKHRFPGANHRLRGCTDVIQTFDPWKQHGASERRFRNYVNLCLANKLRSIRSKIYKDALSQRMSKIRCRRSCAAQGRKLEIRTLTLERLLLQPTMTATSSTNFDGRRWSLGGAEIDARGGRTLIMAEERDMPRIQQCQFGFVVDGSVCEMPGTETLRASWFHYPDPDWDVPLCPEHKGAVLAMHCDRWLNDSSFRPQEEEVDRSRACGAPAVGLISWDCESGPRRRVR